MKKNQSIADQEKRKLNHIAGMKCRSCNATLKRIDFEDNACWKCGARIFEKVVETKQVFQMGSGDETINIERYGESNEPNIIMERKI